MTLTCVQQGRAGRGDGGLEARNAARLLAGFGRVTNDCLEAAVTTATSPETATPTAYDLDDGAEAANAGVKRGVVLLAGALVIVLVVQPLGWLDYYWNPFLVGLAFLAAAASTGRRSPLWGAGLVVGAWGLSKVINGNVEWALGGPFSTAMIGVGGLIAAYLVTRGFAISVASVAWPVVFIGLGQSLHSTFKGAEITFYTVGLAVVYGLVMIANSARQSRQSRQSADA